MKHYINGELVRGEGTTLEVIDPSTENIICNFVGASSEQATNALKAAEKAFLTWSTLSVLEREEWLLKLCVELEKEQGKLIEIMMQESGKPYGTALAEVGNLTTQIKYFIEETKSVCDEMIKDRRPNICNQIIKTPIGVVVAHLAWNFPLMNVVYKLAPALATGCTIVIKPATTTPLSTLYIGEILQRINFPKGVVNILAGTSKEIGETLNSSTIPSMITMIGSSRSGREIIKQSATSIKRFSLELGGNAPAILFKDVNIKEVMTKLSYMKFMNAGQVCVTPNRFFIHKDRIEEAIAVAKSYVERLVIGAQKKDGTVGPLITKRDQQRMKDLVKDAVEKGATLVCGGGVPSEFEKGYYFEPTILKNVTSEMRVYKEEIFGPIMAICEIDDDSDLVTLANDTEYGLAAFVFTDSISKAFGLANKINSGTVCINEPRFDINLPHGGVKESGVGKDCSKYCVEEYYYLKRISFRI